MKAFSNFCDEAERSDLVSIDDCQYWVFERGYKAAMAEIIDTIVAGKTETLDLLTQVPAVNKLAMH
jgi:hypothetical protein